MLILQDLLQVLDFVSTCNYRNTINFTKPKPSEQVPEHVDSPESYIHIFKWHSHVNEVLKSDQSM